MRVYLLTLLIVRDVCWFALSFVVACGYIDYDYLPVDTPSGEERVDGSDALQPLSTEEALGDGEGSGVASEGVASEAGAGSGASLPGQPPASSNLLWALTSTEHAFLQASNAQNFDQFGDTVTISADASTLVVAATREDSSAAGIDGDETLNDMTRAGAVYVYAWDGSAWVKEAYIKASNPTDNDQFGRALAVSSDGNTLVVGAHLEESSATGINGDASLNDAAEAGAVYVFGRSSGVWEQQAYLKASNAEAGDRFGELVSLSADGSLLAVSAPREDSSATGINGNEALNDATFAGAVYLFERNAGAWSQQAYLKASNAEGNDGFGEAVALSADGATLAVGAPGEDSSAQGVGGNGALNDASYSGAAYVFTQNASVWSQQAYLKASNAGASDGFGGRVALSADGDVLAVGARSEDGGIGGINGDGSDDSVGQSGAAYVFSRSGTSWSEEAYVKASAPGALDTFGQFLALSGDGQTLAVGAPNEDSSATGINGDESLDDASNAGAVYLFSYDAGSWQQSIYLKPSNTISSSFFGNSISLNGTGDHLLVGANYRNSQAGSAYLFIR